MVVTSVSMNRVVHGISFDNVSLLSSSHSTCARETLAFVTNFAPVTDTLQDLALGEAYSSLSTNIATAKKPGPLTHTGDS